MFTVAQHVGVQKRRLPVAVQLERIVAVDVLVDVQQGIRLHIADRAVADRTVRRDRAELSVPGDRTAGLVRRG